MIWKSYKINEQLRIKEMFSFFEQECEKSYDFQGEAHNFWECLYVEEGSVCVSADERVYNLEKNGLIFHKPFEFHKFYADSESGAKIFVFSFSLEGELCDYFRNKVFVLSKEQQNIISAMLSYVNKKLPEVEKPNDAEFRPYLYPFSIIKTYSQMLTTYIYQLFLSLADSGTVSEISDSYEAAVFRKAVDYMNSNTGGQPSVSEISKFCNVSEAGLKRLFDRFAGIGVHKYFLQIKIKAATELLKSGVSVSDTAERLGYSSQGYFSAAYKRETGKSPSEIRK